MTLTSGRTPHWLVPEDCRLDDLLDVLADRTRREDYPHPERIESEVVVYDATRLDGILTDRERLGEFFDPAMFRRIEPSLSGRSRPRVRSRDAQGVKASWKRFSASSESPDAKASRPTGPRYPISTRARATAG